jgi:hypothetical protein
VWERGVDERGGVGDIERGKEGESDRGEEGGVK